MLHLISSTPQDVVQLFPISMYISVTKGLVHSIMSFQCKMRTPAKKKKDEFQSTKFTARTRARQCLLCSETLSSCFILSHSGCYCPLILTGHCVFFFFFPQDFYLDSLDQISYLCKSVPCVLILFMYFLPRFLST